MKIYCIAELDCGDFHNIIYGRYYHRENAERELAITDNNPFCEIPLYIVEEEFSEGMKMEDEP